MLPHTVRVSCNVLPAGSRLMRPAPAAAARPLPTLRSLRDAVMARACGKDIVKKPSTRKGRYLLAFNFQLAPAAAGKLVRPQLPLPVLCCNGDLGPLLSVIGTPQTGHLGEPGKYVSPMLVRPVQLLGNSSSFERPVGTLETARLPMLPRCRPPTRTATPHCDQMLLISPEIWKDCKSAHQSGLLLRPLARAPSPSSGHPGCPRHQEPGHVPRVPAGAVQAVW